MRIYDQASRVGGIWNRVFASSVINTPHYGYTFHPTNIWPRVHPTRDDILANIERLVQAEQLVPNLRLNTPVESVEQTSAGLWRLNKESDAFDGLLVCSGYMNSPRQPGRGLADDFFGSVLLPYAFEPTTLRDQRVIVVGSGATALEMLKLAHHQNCRQATLLARPDTAILDLGRTMPLAYSFSGNPLVYRWHRRYRRRPATVAACNGINAVLQSGNVTVNHRAFKRAVGNCVQVEGGASVAADCVIWCTGWHGNPPAWASANRHRASLVVASCRACLDTAGLGHGASTAHAKALDAILTFGLKQPFQSGSEACSCEQSPARHDQHIVLKLARYFFQQPGGWAILRRNLAYAGFSHRDRWKYSGEPVGVKLTSFIQAPLGL